MIAYFDTSALVKRYLVEEGTEQIAALWSDAQFRAVSRRLPTPKPSRRFIERSESNRPTRRSYARCGPDSSVTGAPC